MSTIINLLVEHGDQFLSGLRVTLLLSLFSIVASTIFGSIICLISMSKVPPLKWMCTAYIEIIRGTPIPVSYTHLDVYKRQVLHHGHRRLVTGRLDSKHAHGGCSLPLWSLRFCSPCPPHTKRGGHVRDRHTGGSSSFGRGI